MGLRMSIGHRISMRHSLTITPAIRLQISHYLFGLRMELVQALRAEKYEPQAECPKCHHKLTPVEILRGFNRDPNDFTTACSSCGHRFEPRLICFGEGTSVELPFWCRSQILHHLEGKITWPPEQLAREEPAVYRSAIVHFGTIKAAFRQIGADYPFEEISDWRHIIQPFLGRMPDTMIADCIGMSAATIGRIRRKDGISRCTKTTTIKKIS